MFLDQFYLFVLASAHQKLVTKLGGIIHTAHHSIVAVPGGCYYSFVFLGTSHMPN